jgi:hypothetical protein
MGFQGIMRPPGGRALLGVTAFWIRHLFRFLLAGLVASTKLECDFNQHSSQQLAAKAAEKIRAER